MNLDAYMIRKIAPRLFFAVIGVNLSIYLCVGAIDITTVAGHGAGQLIRGPFDAAGALDATVDAGSANIAAPLLIGLIAGGTFLFAGGVLAALFALMLPIFVLILAILVTLAIRQALLILLTLVSPVAIVLSVLPGTEKYFKQWWDLFIKTLIVYPMIAALFAVSDVLTSTQVNLSNVSPNTTGTVDLLTALIYAFMPLVLIPFCFRFSGGVLGAFTNATSGVRGMANRFAAGQLQKGMGRGFTKVGGGGLFTNTKERDSDQYDLDSKGDKQKLLDENGNWDGKSYKMLKEKYGVRHRLNRGAARASNIHKLKLGRPRKSINNAMQIAQMKQAAAINESDEGKMMAGLDDEHFINTASDGTRGSLERAAKERVPERYDEDHVGPDGKPADEATKAWRRRNLADTVGRIQDYNKIGGAAAGRAASAVALHGISTSYKTQYYKKDKDGNVTGEIWKSGDGEGTKSDVVAKTSQDQMQETIRRVSGNDIGLANWVTVESVKGAKQAGRYDMAASASAVLMYQEAMRSGDQGAIKHAQQEYKRMMKERVTPAQMLQGHPRAAEEMANVWKDYLGGISSKMSDPAAVKNMGMDEMQALQEQFEQGMGHAAGIQDVLSSAAPEASGYFEKKVFGKKFSAAMPKVEMVPEYERDASGAVVYETVNGKRRGKTVKEQVRAGDRIVERDRMVPQERSVHTEQTGEEWLTSLRNSKIFNRTRREYGRQPDAGQSADAAARAAAGAQIDPNPPTNPSGV